jgi:nucleotide-binding universal stress UspA family protein
MQDSQIICPVIDECKEVSPSLIKHILVPFDESQMSYRAFEFALDLAKKYNSKISIITVIYSSILSSSFLDMASHQTILERNKIKQVHSLFQIIHKAAEKFGVKIKSDMILSDHISDSLLAFSSQQNVDLIVMGTRARDGPKQFLFGSVTIELVQRANCPVILVK